MTRLRLAFAMTTLAVCAANAQSAPLNAPQAEVMGHLAAAFATHDPTRITYAFRAMGDYGMPAADIVEASINAMGYELLANGEIEAAIKVFDLNAQTFSASANAWDSLAEADRKSVVSAEPTSRLDLIPCDEVARRIVDSAFDPSTKSEGVAIRHATAGPVHSPSIDLCRARIVDFFERNPVSGGPRLGYVGANRARFRFEDALRHRLPTALASGWYRARGQDRAVRAARRMAERRDNLLAEFPYFTHKSFDFRSSLPLGDDFDPAEYIDTVCEGVHRNLLSRERRRGRRRRRRSGSAAEVPAQPPRST